MYNVEVGNPAAKLGAIVTGLNVNEILTNTDIQQSLYQTFLDHGQLLILRGCRELEWEEMDKLIRLFYPVEHDKIEISFSIFRSDENVSAITNAWHCDSTFREYPARISNIQLVEKPSDPKLGNTLWCNTNLAYESLPVIIKDLAHQYQCLNQGTPPEKYTGDTGWIRDVPGSTQSYNPKLDHSEREAWHPIIHKHSTTGKNHILLNSFHSSIPQNKRVAMLLESYLYSAINTPEFQYRHQWEVNDIAIYDNLSTQHYACSDYQPERRTMNRSMLTSYGEDGKICPPGPITLPNNDKNSQPFWGFLHKKRNMALKPLAEDLKKSGLLK